MVEMKYFSNQESKCCSSGKFTNQMSNNSKWIHINFLQEEYMLSFYAFKIGYSCMKSHILN